MKAVSPPREIIARGGGCLTAEGRAAVTAFVLSRRCSGGGFAGKSSSADLYYTVFAAAVLDALGCRRSLWRLPRYLAQFGDGGGLDFVHLACLAQLLAGAAWHGKLEKVLGRIEAHRSRDGGYNHTVPDAATGTAYALHLAIEAHVGAHRLPPGSILIPGALDVLRASGGGYANTPSAPAGQTNATAATCIVRMRLGLEPEEECGAFLMDRYDPFSGGFLAYPKARTPDLLSTASALYALNAMGVPLGALAPQCRTFVECLWTDDGGFCGAPGDPVPDVEYTFYALLALGALL